MRIRAKIGLLLLLFCTTFVLNGATVKAESMTAQVTDEAGILTDDERRELTNLVDQLELSSDWDIMILSIDDAKGKTADTYAEDWFDLHTTSEDGIICLVDMEHSEMSIRTFGEAIYYLTDDRIDAIIDDAYYSAQEGAFYDVYECMLDGFNDALQRGIPDDQYVYDADTGKIIEYHSEKKRITFFEGILAVLAALASGGITIGVITGKYRLKWGNYQYSCRENGSVDLTQKQDRFVNQMVTHRRIPKNTSSGGSGGGGSRSTTRVSSSGRRSGGGSRKF